MAMAMKNTRAELLELLLMEEILHQLIRPTCHGGFLDGRLVMMGWGETSASKTFLFQENTLLWSAND